MVIKEAIKEIEESREKGRCTCRTPSGFTKLDRLTSDGRTSEPYNYSARPSMGKTALACRWPGIWQ